MNAPFPILVQEANRAFQSTPPREWPAAFPVRLRAQWLDEKVRALSELDARVRVQLERIRSQCPPAPAPMRPPLRPAFLKNAVGLDAVDYVRRSFAGSRLASRVDGILDARLGGDRFSSVMVEGSWRMVLPPSTGAVQDLVGLAHELGHVLNDGSTRDNGLRQLVRSEACALVLEETLVAACLEKAHAAEWHAYQRQLDRFNFYLFSEEMSLTEERRPIERLLKPSLIFRESLWTCHGYQAVFAAASILRAKVLGVNA